jgi:transposase
MQSIEIVGERRRAHDAAFRARVVAESLAPGARVQTIARRHGICSSLIYRWRRLASPQGGAASAVQLVPVRLARPRAIAGRHETARSPDSAAAASAIEIELADGVRVRVGSDVSVAALRRVVAALRG